MAVPFDQLQATTIKYFVPKLRDNIAKDHVYLYLLGSKDYANELYKGDPKKVFPEGMKMVDNMGEKAYFPLRYRKNSTSRTYSRFDTLDITPQDNHTAAEYNWRNYSVNVHLCYEDLDKNRGNKVKLIDLMKAAMNDAQQTGSEEINDLLLGQQASTDDPLGLLDIIKDDPTTNPSNENVGGIDASVETWWRNQIVNHNSAAFGTSQTGTGFQNLRQLRRDVKFGKTVNQVFLAGETAYERVENALVDQQRYVQNNSRGEIIANAGFDVIMVNGIPLCMEKRITELRSDASLTGDAIYAINFESLQLWAPKYRWFTPGKTKEPVQQDSVVTPIISRLSQVCCARRDQGVMFGIV